MYGSLFLFILVHQYIHKVLVNISSYYYVPRAPLEDVLHPCASSKLAKLCPATLHLISIAGEMLLFLFALAVIVWGQVWHPHHFHIMLTRFAFTVIVCQYLRAACFLSTRLPGPAAHCSAEYLQKHPTNKVRSINQVLTHLDLFKNCGDLIFSSHNIFFVSLCCTVQTYLAVTAFRSSIVAFVWILSLLFNATVLINKKHYTVDIILAYIIVFLMYHYLHQTFPDPVLQAYIEHLPF
jgi:hypothetical protein